jgi:class 3 adenylate cyclase/TolB-like protein/Tfp pilus assembly protein PilF
MERRLAAILSIDVVGYSRLMERDEAATLAALKAHRDELIDPRAALHGGTTIKLMGDGALMEFTSAVDAMRFAVAVQLAMRQHNAGLAEVQRIVFRIGINIGDVIAEDGDIHGDGVNLAARLEGLAEPGGVCIHRSVRDQVRDKLALDFDDLGEVEVKNIERPVRAFHVVLDDKAEVLAAASTEMPQQAPRARPSHLVQGALGIVVALLLIASLAWWQPWGAEFEPVNPAAMAQPLPDKPSIVVLPFANRSIDDEQDYLAEGFSAAVRTHLSKFPQLFVIAGTTAITFGDETIRARDIGRELGVRYVLEGSLQRGAESFTVSAELIEAETEQAVWAEQYDFPVENPFPVQAELVQEITSTLRVVIEEEEIAAVRRRPTESPKAYDLYLRAMSAEKRLSTGGRQEAIRLLKQAIELDPDYLDAHFELSDRYLNLWRFGRTDEPGEALRLARHHADRALQLDQTDYRGHFRLGMLHLFADHDHDLAYAAFQRALSGNPNDADILYNMGFLRSLMGAAAEAIEWNDKAKRINPRYPGWYNFNASLSHFFVGDYGQALLLAKAGMAAYPKSLAPRRILIATLVEMGRLDEAEKAVADFLAIRPDFRLSTFRNTPFQNPADQQRYYGAMRAAGIPD